MSDTPRPVRRALLSVADKTGLIDFAKALAGHPDYEIETGEVLLDGKNILEMEADERARCRR